MWRRKLKRWLVFLVSAPLLVPAWLIGRLLDFVLAHKRLTILLVILLVGLGVATAMGWLPDSVTPFQESPGNATSGTPTAQALVTSLLATIPAGRAASERGDRRPLRPLGG